MGKNIYVVISLSPDTDEYKKIAAFCARTCKREIMNIRRIQNKVLLFNYLRRRDEIAARPQNEGKANEELFFHGARKVTDKNITDKILTSGFDRRFAKSEVGALWFSTQADYSVSGYTSDSRIILARVTLGYIGQDSIHKSVHKGKQSTGHVRKDDQVGGGSDNRYTIHDDHQAYPAYTIQFK